MCLRRKKEMQENEPIAVTANAERYYPEDKQGLTAAQVEERQRKGLVNAAVDTEFITTKQIVINNVFQLNFCGTRCVINAGTIL